MANTVYPNAIDNSTTLPPATGDDFISVNANISATEAIETELGITPSGVYADVRTRLDILEARINNPLVPAPNVLNPFFISGTGVTIQTGVGDPNVVLALHPPTAGSMYLRQDGYNLQGLYSFRTDGYWYQADLGGLARKIGPIITPIVSPYTILNTDDFISVNPAVGPVTVNLPANPVVGKGYTIDDIFGNAATNNITVNGNGFLIGNASTYVINTNYGSLTIVFDGFGWVQTSTASGPAGGDLSGSYPSPTVRALQGNQVKSGILTSISDGYVLTWVNADNQWEPKPTNDNISLIGDVNGIASNNHVDSLTGPGTGLVTITSGTNFKVAGSALSFKDSGSVVRASLDLTHGRLTAGGGGSDMETVVGPMTGSETNFGAVYIVPHGTTLTTSNAVLYSDGANQIAFNSPGTGPTFFWQAQASSIATLSTTQFTMVSVPLFQWSSTIASPKVNQAAAASDVAPTNLTVQAQYAFASATGSHRTPGNLVFDIGPPTNGSTTEAAYQFTRNGSVISQISVNGGATQDGLFWLGSTAPSLSNWIVQSDASGLTVFNCPTNGILGFANAGATYFGAFNATTLYLGNTVLASAPILINWTTSTTPVIQTGTSATQLTVGTNKSAANLVLVADANTPIITLGTTSNGGLGLGSSSLTTSGGITTLTAAQYLTPVIAVAGTLTSNATLIFPNSVGAWYVDFSGLSFSGFTLTFSSGTASYTLGTTNSTLCMVSARGSNTIAVLS